MSVLIRGMVMPYGCANCSYMGGAVYDLKGMAHYFCNVDVEGIRGADVTNEVIAMYEGDEYSFPDFCPLIEVKEPHGRLGDLDKLKEKFRHSEKDDEVDKAWNSAVRRIITQAETIIEAEGREVTE